MKAYLLVIGQLISIVGVILSGPLIPTDPLSLGLIVIGTSMGLLAIWTMRNSKLRIMPNVAPEATLIKNGLYNYIRHPMYTSVLMVTFGFLYNKPNLLRLIIYAALINILIEKIKYEETLLNKAFKDYKEYSKRTKRLVPFIY